MSVTQIHNKCWNLGSVLLVVALFAAGGCSSKTETSQKLTEEARAYHQKGDNKTAVIQLKNALQKNPENGEARYLLGLVYNDLGNGASAEKELRKALQFKVDKAKVLPALGKALLAQGQFQKILDEIQTGLETKDATASLLALRGNALLALGRQGESKAVFDEMLKTDAGHTEAYLGMARLALAKHNIAEAVSQTDLALAKSPRNVDAWLMKGDLMRAQANKDQAQAAYRQALQLSPNSAAIHLRLVALFLDNKQYDAAQGEVTIVRKAEPKNLTALYLQALVDFRQKKYPAAQDTLQELLKTAPNYLPSVLLSGTVAYTMGNYELADKQLGDILKQSPGNVFAAKLQAATQLKLNKPAQAVEILQPLLAAMPKDPNILALAGESYLQNKEYAKATELLEKAASIDTKNTSVRTELALSRLVSGNMGNALSELESASDLDTNHYKADTILVLAHLAKKEYDKALEAVTALQKKQPNNPDTYNLQGAAYLGKKDRANARKSFEKALTLQPTYIAATINLAQMDLDDNNVTAAHKRFEDVLANDKNNQQAMVSLALLARRAGQEHDYETWLEKAAKTSTAAIKPRLMLAHYYLEKKDVQRALATAREAQAAKPDDLEALDVLGMTQLANGEKDNALATYSKLATLAPKMPSAHFRLANAQAAMQNTAAARVSLNKALELKPGDIEVLAAMVSLETAAGHFAEAQKIAQQAQKDNPKSSVGLVLEGDVLAAQKQYMQAVKLYDKAYVLNKNGALVIKTHNLLRRAGAAKEGEARMVQWLKEHPDDFIVRNALAESCMSEGRHQLAIEQYLYINAKSPKIPAVLNNLAWLYTQMKDPRAVDFAEQANKLVPGNPNILDTLGWALVTQGKTGQGLEHLKVAVSKAPDNPEVRYHLAVAYFGHGDKQKAQRELERTLDSGIAFPQEKEARAMLNNLKR